MTFLRSALLMGLVASTACQFGIDTGSQLPRHPGVPSRFVGLYTGGFEQHRFRPCIGSSVAENAWRVDFTDAALAQRNRYLDWVQARTEAGDHTALHGPLVSVFIGRVSAEAPRKLGVEPRRTLLVERVLIVREQRGLRERLNLFACASMGRDDPRSRSQFASVSAQR